MKTNWKKGNFIFRGASQRERTPHVLMPENLRIDTRALPGFLSDLLHVARCVKYFNEKNEADGDWAKFLEHDTSIFLASILDNHPGFWEEKARAAFRTFYAAENEDYHSACLDLIQLLVEMGLMLNTWHLNSKRNFAHNHDIPLYDVLTQAIAPEKPDAEGLKADLQKLRSILLKLEKEKVLKKKDAGILAKFEQFQPIWDIYKEQDLQDLEGGDLFTNAMEALRPIFQRMHFTMSYLEQKAEAWFLHSIEHQHDHSAHTGLLLVYAQLLQHLRSQLNEKPKEHLDYFYRDLLQQQFIPHRSDHTIVCFQPADHIREYQLEKNTALSAGTNEKGVASIYRTTEDLLIGKTRIGSLKNIYVAKSNRMKADSSYKLVSKIYAAPVADSKDGQGAPFTKSDQGWPIFGSEQEDIAEDSRNMADAAIGFVIASPVLYLQEGEREIHLNFQFTPGSMSTFFDLMEDIAENSGRPIKNVQTSLFEDAFSADLSTAAGWFRVKRKKTGIPEQGRLSNEINLSLYLSEEDPAVTDNIPEVLGESYDTKHPLIRILLNPEARVYLYSFIMPLELETIRIETKTVGMKSLTLRSNAGLLDASNPFLPFGPVPARNAFLLVGSAELFRKRLTDIAFDIRWNSVPELEGGFAGYYKEYDAGIDNQRFKVKLSALSGGSFSPADAAQQETLQLFNAEAPDAVPDIHSKIETTALERLRLRPDYHLTMLPEYTPGARIGYFKLQLSEPGIVFGHAEYPRLFTQYMLAQTKSSGGLLGGGSRTEEAAPPREPFVPVIERLSVSYGAATLLNLKPLESEDNDRAAAEKIYSIHPFGNRLIFSEGITRERNLFPQLEEDGYLCIGLENAEAAKPVSLFFKIRERKLSGINTRPKVFWSYLQGDQWYPFSHENLLYDSTRGFTTTGIIKLFLPDQIDDPHTLLPPNFFWIRAAAVGNLHVTGQILDVRINAVEAVWEYNGDDNHFNPNIVLPPIENLAKQRSEIASVLQVDAFKGGRGLDDWMPFYTRTSERLRHKNRGITAWDIERLILEVFPEIRRAKCVTCMEYDKIMPGAFILVVIPAEADDLEPQFGFHQLDVMYDFLKTKISPFADIKVINPTYEKIKITCSIRLANGLEHEKGKYLQILHEELLHFICPWLKDGMIQMGGSISKNEVMTFIKERTYVQFLTRFSMIQIYQDKSEYDIIDTAQDESFSEMLHATTPWSILTPAPQHQIQFVDTEESTMPEPAGIDGMRLETDFIILENTAEAEKTAGLKIIADETDESDWYLVLK